MRKIKIKLLAIAVLASLVLPRFGLAAIFDNGYILSDANEANSGAMTLSEIQAFLDTKAGTLKNYVTLDKNGKMSSAAQIIWQAAQEYKINPQFLLILMQREQSLVEASNPTQKQYDWAMGYGICDSCDPDDSELLLFKGFGTQVDKAAWRFRWYYDNADNGWLKKAGSTYLIDGHNIYMANQATANLYSYTPHIKGNYNFWKIWNSWFVQKYPDGSLLQQENEPGVWLIENGMRRPFLSKSALLSRYNTGQIIIVSKNELNKYEVGQSIKFPNYSLLKTPMGNVYLLVNDTLRKFESKEVIRTLGFNPEEFKDMSMDDFAMYQIGEPITLTSSYPAGALLQDMKTGGVYFVQDGKKYPLIAKDIMKINFPRYKIIRISPEELEKYPRQDSIKIKDGELVVTTDSSSVFVISNGTKRPISSGDVFEKLGYKWENIRTVDPKALSNMPMGSYLDLEFKK